jgi:hypothetical protein
MRHAIFIFSLKMMLRGEPVFRVRLPASSESSAGPKPLDPIASGQPSGFIHLFLRSEIRHESHRLPQIAADQR